MRTTAFETTAILALLTQIGFAQVDIINTNTTFTASSYVGTSTANTFPPSSSKYSTNFEITVIVLQ